MQITKAMILAECERDTRPSSISVAPPRGLFPLANRPVLFHNLETLRAAGVVEAAIFAEPHAAPAIEEAVGDGRPWGLAVHHADWDPSIGVGGALAKGRDYLGGGPVVLQHGDAVLSEQLDDYVSTFATERLDALALRLQKSRAGAVRGRTPWYLLSPRAISILAEGRSGDGPVAGVRAQGGRVRIQLVDGCVPSECDRETLLESNRRLLAGLRPALDGVTLVASDVQGPVDIDPTASVRGSLLRGPVIIGPGARITDAYIGPYTSIGAGAVVEGTEIEHSIVLPGAELRFVGTRLESSVIGRGARIVRGFRLPGAIRMAIGDGAEVVLT